MKRNTKLAPGVEDRTGLAGASLQPAESARVNAETIRGVKPETLPANLRLDFCATPLDSVLDYLCEVTGLAVHVGSEVETQRPIDLKTSGPASLPDAVELLEQALRRQGYTTFHKGRTLTVLSHQEAKKHCLPLPILTCSTLSA